MKPLLFLVVFLLSCGATCPPDDAVQDVKDSVAFMREEEFMSLPPEDNDPVYSAPRMQIDPPFLPKPRSPFDGIITPPPPPIPGPLPCLNCSK